MLAHVASLVGDPAVRHRGTLGGSLAHADPASDLPAAAIALRATLVARGPQGDREIGIDDFFTGFLESALAPDELLTEVRVPVSTGGWAYEKFNRRAQDWAIVAAAVAEGGSGVALVATVVVVDSVVVMSSKSGSVTRYVGCGWNVSLSSPYVSGSSGGTVRSSTSSSPSPSPSPVPLSDPPPPPPVPPPPVPVSVIESTSSSNSTS